MRNNIYELAVRVDKPSEPVELKEASLPSKAVHQVERAGFSVRKSSFAPWGLMMGIHCASSAKQDNDLAGVGMIIGGPKLTREVLATSIRALSPSLIEAE